MKMYKTVDVRKMAAFLEGEFRAEGSESVSFVSILCAASRGGKKT